MDKRSLLAWCGGDQHSQLHLLSPVSNVPPQNFTVAVSEAKVSSSQASPPTRILLLEDNDTSRQLMSDYLEYYGYAVFSLSQGSQFMGAVEQFCPHVILLDLKLPDVDGFALLQQLRQRSDGSSIPVIVVSAFAFQTDQQRALSLGASRYFVKPVNLSQLRSAIAEELQVCDGEPATVGKAEPGAKPQIPSTHNLGQISTTN